MKPTGNYTIKWYENAKTSTPLGTKIYGSYDDAKKAEKWLRERDIDRIEISIEVRETPKQNEEIK